MLVTQHFRALSGTCNICKHVRSFVPYNNALIPKNCVQNFFSCVTSKQAFKNATNVKLYSSLSCSKSTLVDNPVVTENKPASLEQLDNLLRLENLSSESKNVFNEIPVNETEHIDSLAPEIRSTFNIAAYVNKSSVLQDLIKLGVNLSKFDEQLEEASLILSVTAEELKNFILFLHSLSVPGKFFGPIITKAPALLKEDIRVLQSRVKYLTAKNFSTAMVISILKSYPRWLLTSVPEVDRHLGFLQRFFSLTGEEVRTVASKAPRMALHMNKLLMQNNKITFQETFLYSDSQLKSVLLHRPRIFCAHPKEMAFKLTLLHTKMNVPLDIVSKFPEILVCRNHRIDNRHYFLKSLNRAQYDPSLPNYVCMRDLAVLSDSDFAVLVAKSSVPAYETFLKTML